MIFIDYTPVTQIILSMIFVIDVCSNHTIFELLRTRSQNTQFTVYISDTPMTLEQSQGHQTYNNNVDPKESYNHAKFERSVSAFSK